jgi:hypothetical protein
MIYVHVSPPDYRTKYYIKVANKFIKHVAEIKYLGTNQNCIHTEINSRLNSENVYYHAAQNVLSSQ